MHILRKAKAGEHERNKYNSCSLEGPKCLNSMAPKTNFYDLYMFEIILGTEINKKHSYACILM